jgi:hypothetical protein
MVDVSLVPNARMVIATTHARNAPLATQAMVILVRMSMNVLPTTVDALSRRLVLTRLVLVPVVHVLLATRVPVTVLAQM